MRLHVLTNGNAVLTSDREMCPEEMGHLREALEKWQQGSPLVVNGEVVEVTIATPTVEDRLSAIEERLSRIERRQRPSTIPRTSP